MKPFILFILFLCARNLVAQDVYTIKADSTKLTGCDSNELIIENHTRNVPGGSLFVITGTAERSSKGAPRS